jgi:5-oxoprolinase (ATP-hydrolysing) subunit C
VTESSGAAALEVVEPGLLTTIQDLGRPDTVALGVPRAGACDPLALAAANLLCGNERGAAALEFNLLGPTLEVLRPLTFALTGADCEAHVEPGGRSIAPDCAMRLEAGDRLVIGAALDGARGYLAVSGGFDLPLALGSASTSLAGRFGGFHGRPLLTGDRLAIGETTMALSSVTRWLGPGPSSGVPSAEVVDVRVLRGPHVLLDGGAGWERLLAGTWDVDPRSDRSGVRLVGTAGSGPQRPSTGIVSTPMVWGAIELPPGGMPICLLADHPTVGGYPVVGVVVRADLPVLGQLRPGHRVRFRAIQIEQARTAAKQAAADLDEAEAHLRAELP